ncbi:L-2-hydroxyglutarate dehydrogenase [Capsaspora owczarzaki ATCC 30864]|uniref:L-2-hydroxyglutarate dehydrogenase, mitochondrial n=1 Tax=Capsaspora owczarzaki (strain ATCC 30864) TaxID=595528 RepID=A0A0D2U8V0_CAPO3|nr:L-2-hydroxyglutarate dehydrogenase [Capsaspora owczarzaki ATCC 30864]KJE91496.1 L-2-hydroxyglutarate dehydrogenase [Capsaspora owczarzaki ATCC 30864]|eukprot:XP_004349375.1 L-2-hydroxyglutarate dehydrogenase [Capsaspora owczarzaki ATCC 30864]
MLALRFATVRRLSTLNGVAAAANSAASATTQSAITPSTPTSKPQEFDVGVIGGGIVGMATARELSLRLPQLRIAVFEKESGLGAHQTGHNSGVIHAGIYYKPGSLKAKLCVEGLRLTYDYCDKKNIPYKKCGKLIVARSEEEIPGLKALFDRGQQNNVPDLRMIGVDEMKRIEPHCVGVQAIHSPVTGIVDWLQVTNSYADDFTANERNRVLTNHEVTSLDSVDPLNPRAYQHGVVVSFKSKPAVRCRYIITCAGMNSDRIAQKAGGQSEPVMVPIRGEYLTLKPDRRNLVNGLIYPVPDPTLPFLGVHFTPTMKGDVLLGPNAVFAFAREGYKFFDINPRDMFSALLFPGFQRLALKYWKFGMGEMYRSRFLSAQVKLLQDYVPEVTINDVQRGMAGIRAQAMDHHGNLVDDFVFETAVQPEGGPAASRTAHLLHVRNAPSPGATSSLAIAKVISDKAQEMFNLRQA